MNSNQRTELPLAELADFIPNKRDRERAHKGIAALKVMFEKARDVQEQRLQMEIDKTSGPQSGDSQAA